MQILSLSRGQQKKNPHQYKEIFCCSKQSRDVFFPLSQLCDAEFVLGQTVKFNETKQLIIF